MLMHEKIEKIITKKSSLGNEAETSLKSGMYAFNMHTTTTTRHCSFCCDYDYRIKKEFSDEERHAQC